MRKIVRILLVLVLAASFSACGSAPAPKDTAERFLSAMKAKDTEGIQAVYDGSYSEDELNGTVESLLGESEGAGEEDEATRQMEEMLFDFDYTIGEERIDGENAEVDVTFKTYDFGTMIGQYLERAFTEVLSASFNGASQEEIDAIGDTIMAEELSKLTEKTYEKTVPLKLTKVENEWKVAKIEDDSEFLNAMLGGMMDIVKGFEELGDSLSGGEETAETNTAETEASEPKTEETVSEQTTEAAAQTEPAETQNTGTEMSSFEGFTAIDSEACSVAVRAIDPDSTWGYEIQVALENKSPDKTYMFSVDTAAVNGVETDPLFATEVAPGKKANESIHFPDLSGYGIKEFTDIELFFRVYNNDDWAEDPAANESFHVYPYGEEKAEAFVREAAAADRVLAENDDVAVIVTGVRMDEIWGYTLYLYLMNKSEKDVMIAIEDASINGYMADPFFASSVKAGKVKFTTVSWSDTTLEENGITEVTDLEFTLRAYDENDWSGDDLINESISFQP